MTRNSHSPHYCVISIGKVKRGLVIEVFCVGRNSWEIVDSMPSWFIITHDRMLECDGLFYSLLSHPIGMLVIGDYVTEGTYWRIESLPLNYGAEPRRLLTCQNSIYMVCRADAYCNHFVIWEYQAVSKSWKKLQDMPDHIREDINCISTSNWADCVGVGWHICFRSIGTLKVLTYNVREGLWSWLPEPSPLYDTLFARGIEFEPKLDYTQSLEYGIMQKSSPY
ncbi:hypothetical protein KP509_28G005500 [Ceratopteris richardii]|nr:hypothetical protein KP509_28G005500 [Ceratopteris richardii]